MLKYLQVPGTSVEENRSLRRHFVPDLSVRINPGVDFGDVDELQAFLREVVAEAMSCEVSQGTSRPPRYYQLEPGEVDVTDFGPIDGPAGSLVIIMVGAFNYEDRMRTINDRIRKIAQSVRDRLGLPEGTVSITFNPIQLNCWAMV